MVTPTFKCYMVGGDVKEPTDLSQRKGHEPGGGGGTPIGKDRGCSSPLLRGIIKDSWSHLGC